MSRPFRKKLFLSAMALSLIAGGFIGIQVLGNSDAVAQMSGEMPPMPVPVTEVTPKPVEIWKEFSARLTAVDYVEIRPQVSGLIEQVHFTDGQVVKEGDQLYTIDQRPYQAAVAQAKADLNAAYSDNTYAKKELERAEELIKTGALSRQVFDQRTSAVKAAASQIAAASARVKSAEVDLDNSQIKAPITGRISRSEITQGNLVNAASAPLLTTIVSDKDIYADFELDEQTYLKYIRNNKSATIETEQAVPVRMQLANDKKWYEGQIQSFDNRINPSSGTIRARAIFTNDDSALLPGMFTRVQVGSPSDENSITITEKAIGTDQNRKFVYVVGSDGTAQYRAVQLGDSVGGERIVTSGLEAGEKVIIDGLMKVRPGAKVQPMSPEQLEQMKAQMAGGGAAPAGGAPATETVPEQATPAPAQEPTVEEAPPAAEPAEPTSENESNDVAPVSSLEGSSLLRSGSTSESLNLRLSFDQTQAGE